MCSSSLNFNFLDFFSAAVVPGAGAFEIACVAELERLKQKVPGKPRLGYFFLVLNFFL